MYPASDRGRDKNGKLRPKSEGFELYNNSVQNGSPESPQAGWDSYPEPKKMSSEDRLLKNRADHRSSPNVASKPPHTILFFNLNLVYPLLVSVFCISPYTVHWASAGPGFRLGMGSDGNMKIKVKLPWCYSLSTPPWFGNTVPQNC